MDEEAARHIAKSAFKSASEFSDLYSFVHEHCDDEELKNELKKALQNIIADIGYELNKKITDRYPAIQKEIDESINKYGFLLRQ